MGMCRLHDTRGRQLSALTVLLMVFYRAFVTCTGVTAEEDHQCKVACASIQGDLSSVDACAKPRKTLPRPKIGHICQEAYTEAFKLTCLEVCQLHNTGRALPNRLGEACNKRKRDVPKPVAHKACVEGFRAGFADTSALVIKKIEEIATASDNERSEHSASLLETAKANEQEATLDVGHVDNTQESQQRSEDRATGYGEVGENDDDFNFEGEVSPHEDEHEASNDSQGVEAEEEKTKDEQNLQTQGIPKASMKLTTPQMNETTQDGSETGSEEAKTAGHRDDTSSNDEVRTTSRVASDLLLEDIAGNAGDDLPDVDGDAEGDEHIEQEVSVDVQTFNNVAQPMESDDSSADVEDELSEDISGATYGLGSVEADAEEIPDSDPERTQSIAGGFVKDEEVTPEGDTMAEAQLARTRSDETEIKDTADKVDVQEAQPQAQESEHGNGSSNTEGGEPSECHNFGDTQDTAGGSHQYECALTAPAHSSENDGIGAIGAEDDATTLRTRNTITADHENAAKTENIDNRPDEISGHAGIGVEDKSDAHSTSGGRDEAERVEALDDQADGQGLRQPLGGGEDEKAKSIFNTTTTITTAATSDGDSRLAVIDEVRPSSSSVSASETIPASESVQSV